MKNRVVAVVALGLLLAAATALPSRGADENPDWSGELSWPREYSNEAGGQLVMYQPQVTKWDGAKRIHARTAIAFKAPGAEEPSLGAFEIEADTEVDKETRLVRLSGVEIVRHRFPSLDEEKGAMLLAKLGELMPKEELIVELDRVLANLERGEATGQGVQTKTDPPKIFVSQKPAVLVLIDGEPIWSPIKDNEAKFVVNTNWDLFEVPSKSSLYLRDEKAWYKAPSLKGPWTPAGKLPKALKKLPKDDPNWEDVRASLPGEKTEPGNVPTVYVSEVPAELIVTSGEPALAIVDGTELLWVTNTESDLFLHGPESQFYYLVSGRWFRAKSLDGPWQFATLALPEDFAKIPEDHPMTDVRASVPGTPEAHEAILLAQIPETATVARDKVTAEVTYAGEPEFEAIEGTSMHYAVNTPNDVIRVGGLYYLCYQGVWFASTSANGPWEVIDSVPSDIYTIPASSPVYHTTYVGVYGVSPGYVTFGYTSGYMGVYLSFGCMVYGTGWYYNPWSYYPPGFGYPYYYGYPYSYGSAAYYNRYTGTYGRGASVYGPYGGAGAARGYNPATGTYGRGAWASGPYNAGGWAEAYNPRTGTYARTRQGANAYSNWGGTAVQRGNDWARTARYSDSRGTVRGAQTSRGGAAVGFRGDDRAGAIARSGSGDLYAGRDGNVYKRGDDGWQKRDGSGWKPVDTAGAASGRTPGANRPSPSDRADRARSSGVDRGTIDQLNRDRQGRTRGTQRSGQYGGWKSGGGSPRSRGSFSGGGRSMGSRGGGVRRRG
jgi:hypothetical protein